MYAPDDRRTRSMFRCRRFWKRGVWRTAFLLLPPLCMSLLLLLAFANCQWNKHIYMFQAYVWPQYKSGWIQPPYYFRGTWNTWYPNGQKMFKSEWRNGKPHGKAIGWHKNGQEECDCTFENGLRHGKWIYWHNNGQKQLEGQFKNDQIHGKQLVWHKNGVKQIERKWRTGNRDGACYYWDENGKLTKTELYDNGKLIKTIKP